MTSCSGWISRRRSSGSPSIGTDLSRGWRLTPAEWARSASHGEHRLYSVFIMLRHLALHDFLHAYRIEELLLRRDWARSAG